VFKTEAVKQFLKRYARPELALLYRPEMEVQVNVAQGDGRRVDGVYRGKPYHKFEDANGNTWKSFRVPWSNLDYQDRPLRFSLREHAEAVGLTGWNWRDRLSHWVGYDVDSLFNHKEGLNEEQLRQVEKEVVKVPWVEVRRSKSGKGLHLYVYLENPVSTQNRQEHAGLARAIMHQLAALTGLDLQSKVDKLGGNLWVWHAKTKEGGFDLVKRAERKLKHPPSRWREHVGVVRRGGGRTGEEGGPLDELVNRYRRVPLDDQHRRLISWFAEQGNRLTWWWDADRHMLVCHTAALHQAYTQLKLRGIFYTLAEGKELATDQNCFAFPLRNGAWVVRRHGINTQEHPAWSRDGQGWTKCVLNAIADLASAARAHGGTETPKGEFVFQTFTKAVQALRDLEAYDLPTVPEMVGYRPATLVPHRKHSHRVVVQVKREGVDPALPGWLSNKKGDLWETIVDVQTEQQEPEPPDELVKSVKVKGMDEGWYLFSRANWVKEPRVNVVDALIANGVKRNDISVLLGQAISNHWELVNLPFQEEWPGDRRWNRDAARLAISPREGPHPTWDAVLAHLGHGLNDAVQCDQWCEEHGLVYGADYLRCWVAALFQEPLRSLPYLFFYGNEDCGKSTFHEALSLLFKRGYARADNALTNPQRFNGELEGAVLCVVEETNLRDHKVARERIKDWVTGRHMSLHRKHRTPEDVLNATHWVQCANRPDYCPVLPGDTRIVVVWVDQLEQTMDKEEELFPLLRQEAPAFLNTILTLELPPSRGRLRVPVISTYEKRDQQEANRTALEVFLEEEAYEVPGAWVKFSDLFEAFIQSLRTEQRPYWTKRRLTRELPRRFPQGRYRGEGQKHIGNLTLDPNCAPSKPLERRGDRLV